MDDAIEFAINKNEPNKINVEERCHYKSPLSSTSSKLIKAHTAHSYDIIIMITIIIIMIMTIIMIIIIILTVSITCS